MMRITILLPTPGDTPIGGVKVLYEHANGLVQKGHQVTVIHSLTGRTREAGRLRATAAYVLRAAGLRGGYGPKRWMRVDPRVRVRWVPAFTSAHVGSADVLIASAWTSAEAALALPERCGRKYYFVQDYEFFMSATPEIKERMAATYRAPFRVLAISPACREMVEQCGGSVWRMVPNGIDLALLRVTIPIDDPRRDSIGFPWRAEPFKRSQDAIAALEAVRRTHADSALRFWTFGRARPAELPDWIEFHASPSDQELVELYNRSLIFVVPSLYEGWGLPGCEAMCCGAALVSTDNGGVRAYATAGATASFCDPCRPDQLAESIIVLLRNSSRRHEIAAEGSSSIRSLSWEVATGEFEGALAR